jgi:hypothetical protein
VPKLPEKECESCIDDIRREADSKGRLETTQHVLQCTYSLDSIKPLGEGHISSVRVRLLHSAVRRRILDLLNKKPGYYNVESDGVPINDQHCISTILTFSAKMIWIALPAQGIFLRDEEIADYIALWRLIAHYMGTPTHPFESAAKAKAWLDMVTEVEIQPTESGKLLANNIIASLADVGPYYVSADYIRAQSYWVNGPRLCHALGIPRPSLLSNMLTGTQFLIVACSIYSTRNKSNWDDWKIGMMREQFWRAFVTGEFGLEKLLEKKNRFDFQYIPEYSTITDTAKQRPGIGILGPGKVERRYFAIMVALFVALGTLTFFVSKALIFLVNSSIPYAVASLTYLRQCI